MTDYSVQKNKAKVFEALRPHGDLWTLSGLVYLHDGFLLVPFSITVQEQPAIKVFSFEKNVFKLHGQLFKLRGTEEAVRGLKSYSLLPSYHISPLACTG